jgi:hypothetical protein
MASVEERGETIAGREGALFANVANTVQSDCTAAMEYVVPVKVPLQPLTVTWNPASAVIVQLEPELNGTTAGAQETLPFIPAFAVIVKVLIANSAATAQLPVIGPVVKMLPDNVPLQPVTAAIWYPVSGVTASVAVPL